MNEGGDDLKGKEKKRDLFPLPILHLAGTLFFFSWSLCGGAESSQLTNSNRPSVRQDVTKTPRGAEAHKSTCCLTNETNFNLK